MPSLISNLYEFGQFRLDGQNRTLRRERELVPLTPKAFDVLVLLIRHGGKVVSKDELMRAVWSDSFVEESNLTQTVFMLRKALGETPDDRYILTIQGQGYKFVAKVREVAPNHGSGLGLDDKREKVDAVLHSVTLNAATATESSPAVATTAYGENRARWRLGVWGAGPFRSAIEQNRTWIVVGAALALVLSAGTAYKGWLSQKHATHSNGRLLLAVLPFQNLTGDAKQEYFSDGLTEEMIMQLGNLDPRHLGVIARTSVMHYKNSQTSLDQVGRELGVQYVLEGSVRRDDNRVRITAQLVQTKDQTHVWARQYDRDLTAIFSLQGEIAREVADEIELTLGDHNSVSASTIPPSPQNYEAYDLYLNGQYFFNKRTAADFQKAIRYFQEAIDKDPKYARAYAGVADSYVLISSYSGQPPAEFMPEARRAALKALDVDESLPEAHAALALVVQNYDWDWQTAEKEYRRAIELNPNYATAHHWYAEHLMWRGRFNEALQESEKARQLDPLSLIIAADNGAILYFSRQYDRAIEKWNSVRQMDPDFLRAHLIVGAYVQKGMYAAALAESERMRERIPAASYWSWRAFILGRARQTAEAQHAVDELLRISRTNPLDPIVVAHAYAGLEDRDQALAWFEKAYSQHSSELMTLKVNPAYDVLRDDPRFKDLLRRVGLAE